jgi:hypothetical protein
MRNLPVLMSLALAVFLLLPSVVVAEKPRPKSKGTGQFASPITEVRGVGEKTEGAAYLATLTAAERKTLQTEGQLLLNEDQSTEGSFAGYIKAVAIFNKPKQRVYDLITTPADQILYLPRLSIAETVERPKNGELTRFQIKVLFTRTNFRVRHWYYPETSRLEWFLDPEFNNDIKLQEGFWQLYQIDENTTVGEYGTLVDTGLAVPSAIQDFFAKKDIPKALDGMRKWVDTDGKYRRD